MNEVIVSVSAMKITPIRPPRLSPWAEALSRKLGRRISKSPSRLRPNATKRAATTRFSHGLLARFWRNEAEKKNEKKTPTAVKMRDDRQAVRDRQAGRLRFPLPLLPLLDEEVDGDRNHRPDAGHHQRKEPSQGRGEQEGDQSLLGPPGDLAHRRGGGRARRPGSGSATCSRKSSWTLKERTGTGTADSDGSRSGLRWAASTQAAVAWPAARDDVQRDVGEGPLTRREARPIVADLVSRLAPQRPFPGSGVRGDGQGDAPGDLVLEELDDLVVESGLGPGLWLAVRLPRSRDLQSGGVEEVEGRGDRPLPILSSLATA